MEVPSLRPFAFESLFMFTRRIYHSVMNKGRFCFIVDQLWKKNKKSNKKDEKKIKHFPFSPHMLHTWVIQYYADSSQNSNWNFILEPRLFSLASAFDISFRLMSILAWNTVCLKYIVKTALSWLISSISSSSWFDLIWLRISCLSNLK